MSEKPTHTELEQRIQELENELAELREVQQAEEAIQNSEARLQALSDASFEALFFSDKGVCLDQNQTAERMFGYSRDEAVGRHGTEWISPEDREKVKNNMLSGYEAPYEVTALRKDGTTFPCEIQARMIEYQGRSIRITALRDITGRRQAEKALRDSEINFRILVENLPQKIFTKNRESVYLSANENFARDFRVSPGDIAGKTDYDLYPGDFADKYREEDKRILNEGKIEEIEEKSIQEGQEVWVHTVKTPIRDDNGNITGILGIFWDITARKEVEKSLRKAQEELEQRVKDRTRELQDANIALNEKTKNLEELNTTLKILLESRERDREKDEEKILLNIKEILMPYIKKLKNGTLTENQRNYIELLETGLEDIISPFTQRLTSMYMRITPGELKVAHLVREGKTSKEIADILNSSERAVVAHRMNLRKKFDLKRGDNLRTFLLSLQ